MGEKGNLISSGQAQRIAIARAYYKNPQIFFLDEATNSLDEKTEHKILKNFKMLVKKRKKTLLLITVLC